jgi:hypothetical protein
VKNDPWQKILIRISTQIISANRDAAKAITSAKVKNVEFMMSVSLWFINEGQFLEQTN